MSPDEIAREVFDVTAEWLELHKFCKCKCKCIRRFQSDCWKCLAVELAGNLSLGSDKSSRYMI